MFIYNNDNGTSNVFSMFFKVSYLIVDILLRNEAGRYSGFTRDLYKRRAKDQEIHEILHTFQFFIIIIFCSSFKKYSLSNIATMGIILA